MKTKYTTILIVIAVIFTSIAIVQPAEAAKKKKNIDNEKLIKKKIKPLRNRKMRRKNDYILFKDGKEYYFDGTNKEIEKLLNSSNSNGSAKMKTCPQDCAWYNGFCFCRIERDPSGPLPTGEETDVELGPRPIKENPNDKFKEKKKNQKK